MAAHILTECGKKAQAVGNSGDTCIDAVASGDVECYVAEAVSYTHLDVYKRQISGFANRSER